LKEFRWTSFRSADERFISGAHPADIHALLKQSIVPKCRIAAILEQNLQSAAILFSNNRLQSISRISIEDDA
jgi:hypothetical protein